MDEPTTTELALIDLTRQKFRLPFDYIGTLIAAFHSSRRCPGIFLNEKFGVERAFLRQKEGFLPQNQGFEHTSSNTTHSQGTLGIKVFNKYQKCPKPNNEEVVTGKMIRAQIHLLVLAPYGYGKTSTFKDLPDAVNLVDATRIGFIGTISKDRKLVKGVITKAAGKCLILDESHNLPPESYKALLTVLEMNWYSRALGFDLDTPIGINMKPKEFEKFYFSVEGDGGDYRIKSRFSCALLGLPNAFKQMKKDFGENKGALLSRMIPIIVEGNEKEAERICHGHQIFNPGKLIPPYKEMMYFQEYDKAVGLYFEMMRKFPGAAVFLSSSQTGMLIRNLGDTCRLAAYFAAEQKSNTIEPSDFKQALAYAPVMLTNYEAAALTPMEYRIFSHIIQGATVEAITSELGCSQTTIYDTRTKLMTLNLLSLDFDFPGALKNEMNKVKEKEEQAL
jgi:hypothetical protein